MEPMEEIMERMTEELLKELRSMSKTSDASERRIRSETVNNLAGPITNLIEMASLAGEAMELSPEDLFEEL